MSVSIEVPKDHHIVTRVSYRTPSHFHSCQGVWPVDRKWWQFWLPDMLYVYCTVEKRKRRATLTSSGSTEPTEEKGKEETVALPGEQENEAKERGGSRRSSDAVGPVTRADRQY